jgi:hypothetical protein
VKLLCRFVHLPKLLPVAGHQHRHCSRRLGTMEQRPVHFVKAVNSGKGLRGVAALFTFFPRGAIGVKAGASAGSCAIGHRSAWGSKNTGIALRG